MDVPPPYPNPWDSSDKAQPSAPPHPTHGKHPNQESAPLLAPQGGTSSNSFAYSHHTSATHQADYAGEHEHCHIHTVPVPTPIYVYGEPYRHRRRRGCCGALCDAIVKATLCMCLAGFIIVILLIVAIVHLFSSNSGNIPLETWPIDGSQPPLLNATWTIPSSSHVIQWSLRLKGNAEGKVEYFLGPAAELSPDILAHINVVAFGPEDEEIVATHKMPDSRSALTWIETKKPYSRSRVHVTVHLAPSTTPRLDLIAELDNSAFDFVAKCSQNHPSLAFEAIRIKTANGHILARIDGSSEVKPCLLEGSKSIRLESVSGSVTAVSPLLLDAPTISAATTNGRVDLHVQAKPDTQIRSSTINGKVKLGLMPHDVSSINVDARSTNGGARVAPPSALLPDWAWVVDKDQNSPGISHSRGAFVKGNIKDPHSASVTASTINGGVSISLLDSTL